ncbi:hypothetical protein V1264_016931 [Littorina saxatilis]|uniref:Uncharacterized protein n=1 Tax=Littorina saxatilis TaxID=31220 RepID=A0AAN9BHK4_9CAEN
MVLQCQWIFPLKPDCMVDSKYRFDYVVNDSVTIGIPHVTEEVAGNYSCQLVPPDRPTESCELQVNGLLNTTTNPYTSTTSQNAAATDVKDAGVVITARKSDRGGHMDQLGVVLHGQSRLSR